MRIASSLAILDKRKHTQTALQESIALQQLGHFDLDLVSFAWDAYIDHGKMFNAKQRRKLRHELLTSCTEWQKSLMAESGADLERTSARMVWARDIATWVADELKQSPKDLLIKSSCPQSPRMLTPLDWQLVRTCQTPLLFVGTKPKRRSGKILVALDFKHTDAKHRHLNFKVLEAARCFAELMNAQVHGIFVVEISEVLRDLDVLDAKVTKKAILADAMPAIRRSLEPFAIPQARMHYPIGKPSKVIARKAQQMNADLLVMGTWAHKMRQIVGLGNTAEKILGKVPCNVLTISP